MEKGVGTIQLGSQFYVLVRGDLRCPRSFNLEDVTLPPKSNQSLRARGMTKDMFANRSSTSR